MQKENPAAELRELHQLARREGWAVTIHFSGENGFGVYRGEGLPEDQALALRFEAIAREIVETEVGSHWLDGPGSKGRVVIKGDGGPFIDAWDNHHGWQINEGPTLSAVNWQNPCNIIAPEPDPDEPLGP